MNDPDFFLARIDNFARGFARDLRERRSPAEEASSTRSEKALLGPDGTSAGPIERRRPERASLSDEDQRTVEVWSSVLQTVAATVGAFDPVTARACLGDGSWRGVVLPQLAPGRGVDEAGSRIAAICLTRLSNLCTQPHGARALWFLRAAARRERLEALALKDRSTLRQVLKAAATLADPKDPFTRALRGALEGLAPPPWLLRPNALNATLGALEFAHPTFSHAPDPSILRRRILARELSRPLSRRSNPVARWLTFGAFMRPAGEKLGVLALSGGSPCARSERLLGLRAAYFGDLRRSVAYLDFRRPSLRRDTESLMEEVAVQFLQQERGEDYRPSMQADAAELAVRDACRRSRGLVILCDHYDLADDLPAVASALRALTGLAPEARWRFVLSVAEAPADWGSLSPSVSTDLDAPTRERGSASGR